MSIDERNPRAAGIVFCTCDARHAPHTAQEHARLPVTVNGKRVKTIDVHAHCLIREAMALMGLNAQQPLPPTKGADELHIDIHERFAGMDAQAIDMEILSINPFWYRKDRETSEAIVKIQNESLAELSASYPDRLGAFASLSLQHPDLAVQELEHAMKKQGLRGAAIGANVAGEEFSDPKFHPVWAKAEELGAVLFIHPTGTPDLAKRLAGNGWLMNVVGYPLDTTIALMHLIFEGTLDKFPDLKIIAAHGGGYLPSYAPRADFASYVSPGNFESSIKLKKIPTDYLKQIYYDALVFTSEALRHLAAEVGSSQIVLGTDHPFPWVEHPVDHVFATDTLTDEEKIAILGGNAARLFGMKT